MSKKVKYFKKGKVHLQVDEDSIACGNRPPIWDFTWDKQKVTCKRCLAKMKKGKV